MTWRARCSVALVALATGCNAISGLHDYEVVPESEGAGGEAGAPAFSSTGDPAGATTASVGVGAATGAGGTGGSGASGGTGGALGGAGGSGGAPPACGDGTIDPGEECDDANAAAGDGCAACVVECDPPGVKDPSTHHCYRLFGNPMDWSAAEQACDGLLPGSALASLSTSDEVELIRDQIVQMANDDFWLGASDSSSEGQWLWLDGSPFTYAPSQDPWNRGQPDGGGGENCLKMGNGGAQFGDEACWHQRPFVCERAPAGALP